eukprot:m.70928 g.70928  ORF g.70928 m.70928 type:complete len:343 (-) comp14117_c0_seq2:29-1057(-)
MANPTLLDTQQKLPTVNVLGRAIPIKYISLVVLIIQNSAFILTLRASRTQSSETGDVYAASTAVVCAEFLKLCASLSIVCYEEGGVSGLVAVCKRDIIGKPFVTLKLLVPGLLYTIQGNLQFNAATYLDAATFQITYQLKILTTAMFSVILLGRRLGVVQWVSLVVLILGVVLIQLPADGAAAATEEESHTLSETTLGLVLILSACMSSGFAGVYFEKVLKGETAGLWVLNIQLATFGVILGLCGLVVSPEFPLVQERGFFSGYTSTTAAAISLQAIGGLVVAVVVKYADSILKGFATTLSIVVSCIASVIFFEFIITGQWFVGAFLVVAATIAYSRPVPKS